MSSKRAKRRKACEGKRQYPGSTEAVAAAIYARKTTHESIVAYRCKFCRAYHIGHNGYQYHEQRGV